VPQGYQVLKNGVLVSLISGKGGLLEAGSFSKLCNFT
jgi:hypothetical protein